MRLKLVTTFGFFTTIAMTSVAFSQTAELNDSQITLGTTPSYFQGNFGTSSTIDIFDDSTFAQFKNKDVRIKLTIPYLSVSGLPIGAQLSGGAVISRGGGSTGGNSSNGKTHGNHGSVQSPSYDPSSAHSASGIGDIELAIHYTIYHGSGLTPSVVPYTKITFGTASSVQGLGTGKNDYEFGVGVNDVVGSNLFPFAHIGYRIVGNPVGNNLQNVLTYDFGTSYAATPRDIITALFSGSQSEQPGYAGPADLIVAYNHNLTDNGSGIQIFFDKGLTNGSPGFGVGVGGQFVF